MAIALLFRMTDDTSIFRTLRADHNLARRLLKALEATEGDTVTRRELYSLLQDELMHHAIAEEHTLYNAMRANAGTKDSAMHSVHEHREIEELLKQLAHIGFERPEWITVMKRLKERVEHHLDEEESEIFMSARNAISAERSKELAIEFLMRRNELTLATHRQPFQATKTGIVEGTLEAKSRRELEKRAAELDIDDARSKTKSELVTKIREAQGTARAFSQPNP